MNILINLLSSAKNNKNPFHGGNEYTNRIVNELIVANKVRKANKLFFLCSSKDNIDKFIVNQIEKDNFSKFIYLSQDRNLCNVISEYKINKLFDPLGVGFSYDCLKEVEVFLTIHGLRGLEMPTDINEYYLGSKIAYTIKSLFKNRYRRRVKGIFRKSVDFDCAKKTIIVVSNHTKYSVLSEFDIDESSIKVFYSPEKLYPSVVEVDEQKILNKINVESDKYFLIVSGKRWVKNTYRAIKAFDELIDRGLLEHKVVITGANEKVKKIIRNKDMFIALDYVESLVLEVLYKNAFSFVYPSLNEGFGYPPLEAMKYGIPVIAAMDTSIPEVVGEACLKFSPHSISELKARILEMQLSLEMQNDLSIKSNKRYEEINKKQKEDLSNLVEMILE